MLEVVTLLSDVVAQTGRYSLLARATILNTATIFYADPLSRVFGEAEDPELVITGSGEV